MADKKIYRPERALFLKSSARYIAKGTELVIGEDITPDEIERFEARLAEIAPAPAVAPAKAPAAEIAPAPDAAENVELLTVAEIKAALDEKGIAYGPKARKAELLDLLDRSEA